MTSNPPPEDERDGPGYDPWTWEELMARARRYSPEYHEPLWTPEEAEQRIRKDQPSWFSWQGFPGVSAMMDRDDRRLALKFRHEPTGELLEAVIEAGIEFRPDYKLWQNVWVRSNDYAGWLKFRAIYRLLQSLDPEPDSPAR